MAAGPPKVIRAAALPPGTLEERRALLQRVLWSRYLEKAGRIRELLTYVCEASFASPTADIHEQEIGEQVFGKPVGYETTQDNIVRVTASQARKKLEQYFAAEGATESIVLEIPKGQYMPVFRERRPEPVAAPLANAPPDRKPLFILAGLCVVLLAAVVVLAIQLHSARKGSLESSPNLN